MVLVIPKSSVVMIYIIFVQLETLMLHAMFQDLRPFGSGEDDFKGFDYL